MRFDIHKYIFACLFSINMSSRQLTHIETDLLAKGLNFSIPSKTLPNKDIIATVEDSVKDLEKEGLTQFVTK